MQPDKGMLKWNLREGQLPVGGTGGRHSPEEAAGRCGSSRWQTLSELLKINGRRERRLFGGSLAVGRQDVEK